MVAGQGKKRAKFWAAPRRGVRWRGPAEGGSGGKRNKQCAEIQKCLKRRKEKNHTKQQKTKSKKNMKTKSKKKKKKNENKKK